MKFSHVIAFVVLFTASLHAQEAESEDVWPDAFCKHLKGTIGDKLEVEMQLQAEPGTETFYRDDREFRGHYWYVHKRIPIELFGEEPDFGKVKLEEQVYVGGDTGWDTTGTFEGELKQDGTFIGTWTDKDGKRKLPFKLSQYQPQGSVKTTAHALHSQWSERRAEGAGSLEHTALIVQVAGDTPAVKKINQVLLKDARDFFAEPNTEEEASNNNEDAAAKKKSKDQEEELTLDLVSEALAAERDDELIGENQNWSFSYTSGVELSERNILCTSHLMSTYTGGAHPNGGTVYFTFDTTTGKEITLEQIFKPGFFEALPKIATEKYRQLEKRGKDDEPTIESVDFKEEAGWFVTAGGFVIHYDPYAIASYARGNVQLTIPWSELAPWMKDNSPLKPFLSAKK
jgi:hypothetical protein